MDKVMAIPFHGDKGNYAKLLDSVLGDAQTYIEPFGGGFSAGLTLKAYDDNEDRQYVYNDQDDELYFFFKGVKTKFEMLSLSYEKLMMVLMKAGLRDTVEVYQNLRSGIKTEEEFGAMEFMQRASTKGYKPLAFENNAVFSPAMFALHVSKLNSLMKDVILLNVDYRSLELYNTPDTFWFIDPPYEMELNAGIYTSLSLDFDYFPLISFVKKLKGDYVLILPDRSSLRFEFKDSFVYSTRHVTPDDQESKFIVVSNLALDMSLLD